ncbi:MAG TPA: M1 family metallopeptidase [Anaerolineae bacterium]|nr:M1 family metallopeptidase [Anaerolineae bacterium]
MSRKVLVVSMLTLMLLVACQLITLPLLTPKASPTIENSPIPKASPVPSASPSPSPEPSPTVPPPSQTPVERHEALSPFSIGWDDRQPFASGLIDSQQVVLGQLEGASIYHMDLFIADEPVQISGTLEVRYTNQEHEPLDEVDFRLYPNLFGGEASVENVVVEGTRVEPGLEGLGSVMRLPLPESIQPGDQIVIGFDFIVDIPANMSGNYGLFSYFDGVLALNEFYPVVATYDDQGWSREVPSLQGDVSYYDASFYLVRVSAPASLVLVTSGVEVDRVIHEGRQSVTFAAGPIRNFYMVGSERYVIESSTLGEIRVNSYAYQEYERGAEQSLIYIEGALRSFSDRFAPYPYTEFDVVSIPMYALGMEYPGIVAIFDDLYDPGKILYGMEAWDLMENVIAHEVGHQWFYNLVGSDQINEPWLDEAFAQFLTSLYYLDIYGPDADWNYRQGWEGRWNSVGRADIPIGMPVADYEGGEYSAIVYGRGPIFVKALQAEMGEQIFADFLCDYVETYAWALATTEDFRQLAEAHCGCDLSALFEAWVYP